mmetsp:Transcript_6351/g.17272  ORF Transcript_6351/g.17272 Transcript_6351/m.17272 type:complete len:119 (+) Transcript_6351:1306-1662(+)
MILSFDERWCHLVQYGVVQYGVILGQIAGWSETAILWARPTSLPHSLVAGSGEIVIFSEMRSAFLSVGPCFSFQMHERWLVVCVELRGTVFRGHSIRFLNEKFPTAWRRYGTANAAAA